MIRKIALTTIAILALTFGSFAGTADAQGSPTATPRATPVQCPRVGYNGCVAYPSGGFGDLIPTATPIPTAKPTSSAVVSADNVAATTGSGAGGASIAFTGSESRVLGYVGAGLIGFGSIALVAARRRSENELE